MKKKQCYFSVELLLYLGGCIKQIFYLLNEFILFVKLRIWRQMKTGAILDSCVFW